MNSRLYWRNAVPVHNLILLRVNNFWTNEPALKRKQCVRPSTARTPENLEEVRAPVQHSQHHPAHTTLHKLQPTKNSPQGKFKIILKIMLAQELNEEDWENCRAHLLKLPEMCLTLSNSVIIFYWKTQIHMCLNNGHLNLYNCTPYFAF